MSAPSSSLALSAGEVIAGKFHLVELLGSGGYGEVWRAKQRASGSDAWREVALKLLPLDGGDTPLPADVSTSQASSGGGVAHAIGEALAQTRAASAIRHDALATVYDVDVDVAGSRKMAFLSMELLQGETLEQRLARGPVHWRRALAIARDIARALVACHAAGVVHCDLKPQNVLVTPGGRVVVLDFGVAALRGSPVATKRAGLPASSSQRPRRLRGADEATEPVSARELPGVGPRSSQPVVGTSGYIAPERFEGHAAGPAVDVYALGVVLHRMIAGQLPYARVERPPPGADERARARYEQALLSAAVQGDIEPLARAAPGTPRAVCELVGRLLARAPERLPPSELEQAMERAWLRPAGVPDPPYVGLAAFDAERAGYLAGRDADIDAVVSRLERDERVVVLCGPSGAGKSSLAVAGIAPRLDERMSDATDGWRCLVVRPSEAGALALATADATSSAATSPRIGRAVVIDQLEELLALPDDERDASCAAIVALARAECAVSVRGERIEPGDPLRVLATVRDDLFGRVALLPGLERIPERHLYTVRGVDPNAAAEIVAAPARAAGFEVEGDEEVSRETAELLRRDPTVLPLVQFALTLWWDRRDRTKARLRLSDWHAIGGIEGALGSVAQALHDELDEADRRHMRHLLVSLFTGEGTRAGLRTVPDDAASRRVLDELVRRRLVRRRDTDRGELFEVVHEALGRRWPTLRRWLETSRAERQLAEDLERDAGRWAAEADGGDLLWRGRRLADAISLLEQRVAGHDDRPRDFVDAGVAAERRERRKKRAPLAMLVVLLFAAVTTGLVMTRFEQDNAEHALEQAKKSAVRAAENEMRALHSYAVAKHNADLAVEAAADARRNAGLAKAREDEARDKAHEAEEARRGLEKAIRDNRACQGAIRKMLGNVAQPEP